MTPEEMMIQVLRKRPVILRRGETSIMLEVGEGTAVSLTKTTMIPVLMGRPHLRRCRRQWSRRSPLIAKS